MDTRSYRPSTASAGRYASSMPIPPNSYISPTATMNSVPDNYRRRGYDGTRSGTATVVSDGGESEEEDPSWYRQGARTRQRRRHVDPRLYPEYDDDYDARRPISAIFEDILEGVQNRLRGRSARPQRPAPYNPAANANANNVANIAAPTPRRSSVESPLVKRSADRGSSRGSYRTHSASSTRRPLPAPLQPPPEPVIPPKFSPSPPPSSLGPVASFNSFLHTLRHLPFITPNSFSSRGERAPITLTYTPSTSSSRAVSNMSRARVHGAIRYGRRGEEEGELAKGESWYMRTLVQEQRAARRAVRKSIRVQERERRRSEREGTSSESARGRHDRSSSMAYSYSHGPPPPLRPASSMGRGHERRPTGSSQQTHRSPPPSYQGHAMVMPSPYGVVPAVAYGPYGGYAAAYGYPMYMSQPVQQQAAAVVQPTEQQQRQRRLSGSSGRSQRSRRSGRSRSRSRPGSEEGSIVPVPPEELPPALAAAVSAEAGGAAGRD